MKLRHIFLAATLATASMAANADLHAVGPTNLPSPPGHGFPFWYQDNNGTVLDFCMPNASDPGALQLNACLLTGIGIDPPFVFPGNFPEEVFYFRAVSDPLDMGAGKRAIIVLALEGAFATGPVVPGDQVVFTRIRVTAGVPQDGDYTVVHPYGVENFPGITASPAGNRDITFSEDVGLTPGGFTEALTSRVGPFLSAADSIGNPLPPVTLNGAAFLSDGLQPEFVTGSPFGTNYVLICGKDNAGNDIVLGDAFADGSGRGVGGTCARTDLFSLTGRLHDNVTNPIPSPLSVTSATYSRDAGGTHIDVYANAGKPLPSSPTPDVTIAGLNIPPVKMVGPDVNKNYYAQDITLPGGEIPGKITAINSADNPPSTVEHKAVDVLRITAANYDPTTFTMTVEATSSDKGFNLSLPPNMVLLGYPGIVPETAIDPSDPAKVRFTVVMAATDLPPNNVTVQSDVGGSRTSHLNKGILPSVYSLAGVPFAQDDFATVEASGPAVIIPVTANDIVNPGAPITNPDGVTLVPPPPATGTATVNTDNTITFTPGAVVGPVDFKYTVASSAGLSNTATVTVDVTAPAGGPIPIANPDGVTPVINVTAGQAVAISVLDNDSGNGGTLDPASVVISNVTGGTASVDLAGVVTYSAGTTAGTFGFDYSVANTNGQVSPAAHVTVTVVNPENITVAAQCKRINASSGEWVINGTSSVTVNNTIVAYNTSPVPASPTAAQTIGSGVVGAGGSWTIKAKPGPACVTPISVKSSLNTTRINLPVAIK